MVHQTIPVVVRFARSSVEGSPIRTTCGRERRVIRTSVDGPEFLRAPSASVSPLRALRVILTTNYIILGVIHPLRNAKFSVFDTPSPYCNAPFYSSPCKLNNSVTNRCTLPPPSGVTLRVSDPLFRVNKCAVISFEIRILFENIRWNNPLSTFSL